MTSLRIFYHFQLEAPSGKIHHNHFRFKVCCVENLRLLSSFDLLQQNPLQPSTKHTALKPFNQNLTKK
ncbi:hypothetical protein LWI29_019145 [Acer saccharum]|uniref:Uncharacterized protein n=1 Tax=Acer saccharum TaxID=4024 RepID=A0AA39UUA1_ACESA|nr:hypothetical protein LWI29_019145 [Acer saccharum]